MKHLKQLSIIILTLLLTISCSNDDDGSVTPDPFVVAFENLSTNLTTFDLESTVNIVYSETTTTTGSFIIEITETNAVYGVDYTTTPAAVNNAIVMPIQNAESTNSFTFNKINATIDEEATIQFDITDVSYNDIGVSQGNTTFEFNNSASLGGSIEPEIGGPNQPNMVFVDLSNNKISTAQRDSWDLEFYSGTEFRVGINATVYMMAEPLSVTDIDAVSASDAEVINLQPAMNIGQEGANAYVDGVNGAINETAIGEISQNDAENPVYLINLGFEVPNTMPNAGSVDVDGDPRGWKKIRILRTGDDYTLQYADLDDTTHEEVTISKSSDFNYTFFSFNTNQVVDVEPEAAKWDLGFSVFTNVIAFGPELGAYGFADFVIHNRLGGVAAYSLDGTGVAYDDFTTADIDGASFNADQNVIGSSWRSVFSGTVTPDIFYILEDPSGNIYKLRFLALTNENGERGFPEFEFELLQ